VIDFAEDRRQRCTTPEAAGRSAGLRRDRELDPGEDLFGENGLRVVEIDLPGWSGNLVAALGDPADQGVVAGAISS
jgi:hypothetical protein